MVFYQHVYLCTICVPGVKGGWKRALSPLEWMSVGHHVDAGNGTQVC